MPETRNFNGELSGDCFVVVVRLGEREPHCRIHVKTEADVREMLEKLKEKE